MKIRKGTRGDLEAQEPSRCIVCMELKYVWFIVQSSVDPATSNASNKVSTLSSRIVSNVVRGFKIVSR